MFCGDCPCRRTPTCRKRTAETRGSAWPAKAARGGCAMMPSAASNLARRDWCRRLNGCIPKLESSTISLPSSGWCHLGILGRRFK
eukprot:scaffold186692_cov43-Tisochrysis_lutea.AAC.1